MSNYCYTCMNEIPEGNFCPHCHKENVPDNVVYRLTPGTVLDGKYLIGNCLGEGGFGITYIGRDLTLDIKIAVKEYFPNGYVNRNNTVESTVTATTEGQKQFFNKGKERFLEEARKVAKFLGEPGIVGIREYFEANGTAYIIMEYLEGENLAVYIKHHGVFPPEKIFRLMLPITQSLKRVHNTGLIHRDISPDNIMYLSNGNLKLMDFGSARYFTNEQKEMSVLLKKGYAPEEQYRKNGKQGPWTDVYGLCATIYRCLTGNIPEDALDRLREDTLVPPSKMGIAIPPALENILLYGMAVFKENRCQSMDELSSLIEMALDRPREAEIRTAQLNQRNTDGDERTSLADDFGGDRTEYMPPQRAIPVAAPVQPVQPKPLTPQPVQHQPVNSQPVNSQPVNLQPARAVPVSGRPVARPLNADVRPVYARPLNADNSKINSPYPNNGYPNRTPYAAPMNPVGGGQPSPSSVPYGSQMPPAPKKKKTGLIIGLSVGAAVIVAAVIILVVVLGNKGGGAGSTTGSGTASTPVVTQAPPALNGTYTLAHYYSNGTDYISNFEETYTLTINNNKGKLKDGSGNTEDWVFDPQTNTMTVTTQGGDVDTYPYTSEGNKITVEDEEHSAQLIFEK